MFFLKRNYTLLICFVFALSAFAQERDKAIPLKTILQTIEKEHHVIFNYIDTEIVSYIIPPPKSTLTLNEKINYLQNKTNLSFENINNQFITVFNKSESDSTLICGHIFSRIDNSPLENANIQIGRGNTTVSDKKGYFELKNENSNEIVVSFIGFTTIKITIPNLQNQDCITIYLEQEISELDDITTNHFLTSGISKTLNGTYEIKPKKLGLLPGLIESDVLQTLQQIPGINSADESVANINVRGGTHDQNLFLWNGIKMYQTGHFFGLISAFNPNLAHTVSIYKNGTSAFYGESVSSVVDISSDTRDFEKNSFGAGINLINADVYSKFYSSKKGFFEISARRSITDLVETPTYKQYFDKAFQNTTISNFSNQQNVNYTNDEKFYFSDVTVKYSQKIGLKNHFTVDFISINDRLNVYQTNTINSNYQSENNTLYQKNYGGNLSWERNWNTQNTSKINTYSSSYELDAKKNKIQDNQIVKQENKILDNGIKLENHHVISSKFTFNNGYQFSEIGASNLDEVNSPSFYRRNKSVLRIHALVLEGKYNDTISKVSLNAGIRINYIEQFNRYLFEPRLQFNYGIFEYLNLEILGEFKSQNCFQIIDLQKDYFGIEKRRWILANNTTIPIQRSKQASISLTFAKNNWLITLENYYKKVSGINSSGQGFQNQLEFEKINGDYEVFGTEILLQKKIDHFISWISYTYNDNNYYFPNFIHPSFSNNFKMDHVITWAGIYEKDNLKIALGSKWYSGRPETTPVNDKINNSNPSNPTIEYNSPNNKHLEPFFQINFSTTYKWKNQNGIQYKLGFSILNVLNKQNEISEYYRINTASNSIEDVKTLALLRTPNLSFRVNF
ncbi:TonB-dependent receptor [Flavobacterium psychrotolerans]|uniref:TonB-dependent receptor n=1 Tax=Flavobacterium psychrotolerans TaxID=2169410 RepID=A0A2U1JQ06_9FLAO|nr:TonB-dependent receptor [Flavobacterium psychrotolerans]PWA07251.1 TonB-dependent receptor [Flavobacterium psychrotolerans]